MTEAMVTPRTRPAESEGRPPMTIRFCHSCGTRTEPGSSYCLACGVRFGAPVRAGEATPARPEHTARARAGDPPVAGVSEPPSPGWDGQDGVEDLAQSGSNTQRVLRSALISILVVAVLVVGYGTLRSGEEPAPAATEETSPTTTEPDADLEFRAYADLVGVLGDDVADLRVSGRQINDDWDGRIADYDTTVGRMSSLISRAGLLPIRFNGFTRPADADRLTHERMAESLETLVSAAEGMMAGLESTDTGEIRLAQLARFEAAAAEFGSLADEVERATGSR